MPCRRPQKAASWPWGYALCGAGFAVLLSAGWRDVGFAALLSLVVYAITSAADRSQWLANRVNFTAALAASLLANLLALLFPGSNAFVVTLCAVVVLVPGLAMTVGIAELAAKMVLPGIARLVDGVLITSVLLVGSALGSSLVQALWSISAPIAAPAKPVWITFLSVILLMMGLALVFQVRWSDLGWVILAGGLAYTGVIIGNQLGTWQGSFLGALILGLYTSLFTLRRHRPGSVVMLPGIMILVPGAAAYFGLNTLQTSGIIGALPAAWGVVVQIAAIIGGLFVAASVLPQQSSL
ncbi:MAG: threonine/serine exporter family protein [Deltaproteobacteria bacterium]|nr:threonine/serine exporter family protein [Deltaproteobacteria bacterium]